MRLRCQRRYAALCSATVFYFCVFMLGSSAAANSPHGNQIKWRNSFAFTTLGLNIAGGSFVHCEHFMPAVGAFHRSGAHGGGGTDGFQHFVHSLRWALIHRHPSFILKSHMDHDSSISAAQSGIPALSSGFPMRIWKRQRSS